MKIEWFHWFLPPQYRFKPYLPGSLQMAIRTIWEDDIRSEMMDHEEWPSSYLEEQREYEFE